MSKLLRAARWFALAIALLFASPVSAKEPAIWFGPLPALHRDNPHPYIGSLDFMSLFQPDALWSNAATHIKVFKINVGWINHASNADLRHVVQEIKRRGMAIAFEIGPLPVQGDCGKGVEGFTSLDPLAPARRIVAAGGTVGYVTLDEPFVFASIYKGKNACHWPAERVARELASYRTALRKLCPGVVVGDIEPLWRGMAPAALEQWLEDYRATTGAYPDFLHLDVDFSRPDWPQAALELETYARARGIRFGIFYTGDATDRIDALWVEHAAQRALAYERDAGGRPDDVIFQSWHDHPDYLLPETEPTTFTYLINRYLQERAQQWNDKAH